MPFFVETNEFDINIFSGEGQNDYSYLSHSSRVHDSTGRSTLLPVIVYQLEKWMKFVLETRDG